MSHVFRFHSDKETLDGWDLSSKYGNKAIKAIVDPTGGKANLPITSIPTPFASLELVKSAFAFCVDNNIDGSTIYHKLVSYALDVLEIFFNYPKYREDFDIISWDVQTDLQHLLSSEEHRRLGETLELFLSQDKSTFNFDEMSNIYMLDYKKGPDPINVVGGTSPTSLCIASSNNLDYVKVYLSNGHRAFDSDTSTFQPLYERDEDFIRYIWAMSKQPQFGTLYLEVNKYINACFSLLGEDLKKELRDTVPSDYNYYPPLLSGSATMYFAGGIRMGTKSDSHIQDNSDFRIKTSKYKGDLPLVLPYTTYTEPKMRYTTGMWDSHYSAPIVDDRILEKRTLPYDGTQYPYFTVNDIFEPYIIKTVFPINEDSFFTAGFKDDKYSYLIPLKKEIFKYFTLDELQGLTNEIHPKPVLSICALAMGSVQVTFNIPIQKGKYITFERIYYLDLLDPDIEHNKGSIVTCTFDLFLFPSYHQNNADMATPQRVYIIDEDTKALTKQFDYSVQAYCGDASCSLPSTLIKRADKNRNAFLSSMYYCLDDEFDFLQVSNGFSENLLIPKYKVVTMGSKQFEFAIDFGTTNTHIEYKAGNQIYPFEITKGKKQVLSLHDENSEDINTFLAQADLQSFYEAILQEFVPLSIGNDDIASFPLRTNLCAPRISERGSRSIISIADYSIGFHFEKKLTYADNECITNLKWSSNNEELIKTYFEELLMLIRNKVILEGGDLSKTKITWFYPISMTTYQHVQLKTIWEKLCKQLIGQDCLIQDITESLAPYYYYKNSEGVNSARRPVVSMDIGGGTTDFVVYQKNVPALISSVRFAGNNLYGDFIGINMQRNGFFKRYEQKIATAIAGCESVKNVYNQFCTSAPDYVSFLYSLEKNIDLNRQNIHISFSDMLSKDSDMKIVLLFFYVSELYYIANLMKKKNIPSPGYITLSGSASKMLNLIGGREQLQDLACAVFNDVIGDYDRVELKQVPNPKEITCKGGLNMDTDDFIADVNSLRCFFIGAPSADKSTNVALDDIDDLTEREVLQLYRRFVNYFFDLDNQFSFADKFGVSNQENFDTYKKILTEKDSEDLATVLDERRKAMKGFKNPELDDSLFFFPLWGGINRLAFYISDTSK